MSKRLLFLLAVLLIFQVALLADFSRRPGSQFTGRLYVGAVHVYQTVGRPLLKGKVACRYRPTCSDYSVVAVEKHGLVHGLVMTVKRISSCTSRVPMGTVDPVPE